MRNLTNQETEGIYVFGAESKFGEFFYKHPWYTTLFFFLALEFVVVCMENDFALVVKSTKLILPLLIANIIIARYFTKNYCYKVIIDKNNNTIEFYLMFNQGIIKERIAGVNIVVDRSCKIIISKRTFIVFAEMLHKIVPFLPEDTGINYVGFFGRLKKRDWDKTNRRLKPGGH